MDLTPEDVTFRMETFANYSSRINELKKLVLDFDAFGDEDYILSSMVHQEELIGEIRNIYLSKMAPMIEEMIQYICETINIMKVESQFDQLFDETENTSEKEYSAETLNETDKSRENALDMGTSILKSIINKMTEKDKD